MRNRQIDVLRFLGLSLIILAHINPPGLLFQIRNFDVPLMVIISGASFMLSSPVTNHWSYIWKRIKRLAFPAWTFLTIYYSLIYIFKLDFDDVSINTLLLSYTFLGGMGFLWVIRIFLTTAILAPFVVKANNAVPSTNLFLMYIGLSFAAYELACQLSIITHGPVFHILKLLILPTIGYSLIFLLGVRIQKMNKQQLITVIAVAVIWLVTYAIILYMQGNLQGTQAAKYPPNTYYFSYAVALSFICWLATSNIPRLPFESLILFISRNTLWIYFWHIVYIKACDLDAYNFQLGALDFVARYLLLYTLSVLSYFLQYSLLERIILPKITHDSVKKNLRVLFIG